MKKTNISDKNKKAKASAKSENIQVFDKLGFIALFFLNLFWLLPGFARIFYRYKETSFHASLMVGLAVIAVAVLFRFLKKDILKILSVFVLLVPIALVGGVNLMLSVFPFFSAWCIYRIEICSARNIENTRTLLVILTPLVAIAAVILNFNTFFSETFLISKSFIVLLQLFAVFFIMRMTVKKSGIKGLMAVKYRSVLHMALYGVISAASAFLSVHNYSFLFFPWFFFLTYMIYVRDPLITFLFAKLYNGIRRGTEIKA